MDDTLDVYDVLELVLTAYQSADIIVQWLVPGRVSYAHVIATYPVRDG
jgi:hypothetical protein